MEMDPEFILYILRSTQIWLCWKF